MLGAKIAKPLPVPVGKLGPGVSRLSERDVNVSLGSTVRDTVVKKSKFFGSKSAQVDDEAVQLVWHSSDPPSQPYKAEPEAGPSRSPSASPVPSLISPSKAAEVEESFNHLTSPVAPALSSPATSTPPHAETLTSPRRPASSRSRSATPVSPTQPSHQTVPRVLIPSTSQIPNLSQTPTYTPTQSSPTRPSVLGTSTYSNYPSSSDSFELEEIVTPSLPEYVRQCKSASRENLGKRARSDENEEVTEEEQATKAKVIAKDWRLKYAFGGINVSAEFTSSPSHLTERLTQIQTPTVRPLKKTAVAATSTPTARVRAPVPLSATGPRILATKPLNIPVTHTPIAVKCASIPVPASKPRHSVEVTKSPHIPEDKVDLVQASSSPMRDGARLDRYMFAGKVDTRQTSSPSL